MGTSGPSSRWSEIGGASLRWGSGDASEGRTFEDDLALLEGQILTERLDRECSRLRRRETTLRIRAF